MGKILTTIIDRFDGGLVEDKRDGWQRSGDFFTTNKFSLTKHFDAYTYPKKLVPYYKTEAIEDKTYDIVKFLYAPAKIAATYRLYGFGVVPGTFKTRIYYKQDESGWTAVTGGDGTTTNRSESVFFYYKDGIYVWRASVLMRYDISAESFSDNWQSIPWTNVVAQPVHHSADDHAYFFADNLVYSLNDTVGDGSIAAVLALTLPSNLKIVSACEYGNYLAIGCVPVSGYGNSVVYLWDRDSSLTTISSKIDFGEGTLRHLANLENNLIGVVASNLAELYPKKVQIRKAAGDFSSIINELIADNTAYIYSIRNGSADCNSVVYNNKLYFAAQIPLNGDKRIGIWVVDAQGKVTLDFIEEEAVGGMGTDFQGMFRLGNTWWIAHSNDGSVQRTDDDATYSGNAVSTYETPIFNAGQPRKKKKLLGITVSTDPLPTSVAITEVILKYRKDEETSWTQIFSEKTDNSISHSAINIESSGAVLPEFKEIQFQIISIGGAVITGLEFQCELTGKDLYE